MKLLVAKFQLESNAHVPMKCDMEHVALSFGQEALKHMQLGTVLDEEEIEVIPVLCADAACSGVMRKGCFAYIEQRILFEVSQHKDELDGIYLHLHGASEVEEIGSGEHHLVRAIRTLVGPYLPIAISCDPHGNLCQTYVDDATILRSYRESPHTDIAQTVQFVCQSLIQLIKERKYIKPVYRKLPLILGGEQSVSTDEPVRSINQYMNELEKDPRILSCSWHVGYLRHDTPVAGCGIVVVPSDAQHQTYGNEIADQLATYVWEKRHEFHYTGLTAQPKEALQLALHQTDGPVFLTDSGDNVTSGAMGANTYVLRQVLEIADLQKKVLFAAINDKQTYLALSHQPIGTQCHINLGMGVDELTKPVSLDVSILAHGRQEGTRMYGEEGDYGGLVCVQVNNRPITIVITENNHSFVEIHQIQACGVEMKDFDLIVVKQGYIHPELKEAGTMSIMSLTDGATPQDTKLIPFKRILRPMYPIDEI